MGSIAVRPRHALAKYDPYSMGMDSPYAPTDQAGAGDQMGGGGPNQDATNPPGVPPDPNSAAMNPYTQSLQGYAPTQMASPSVPYYGGTDLAQQFQNNRNLQQNQGDMLGGLFGGEASDRAGLEKAAAVKGNALYDQLEQQPGYSPDQQNNILRTDQYNNLLNTDYGSNFLTPDEQQKISGNPYDPGKRLDSGILDDVNSTSANMRNGAVAGAQDRLGQNYGVTESNLRGAVDPNQLNISRGYQDQTNSVMNATGDKVNTAAYNPELDMSGEYGRQAGMTDQEVADAAAMGGQAAGARSRSAIQDLERSAAASGNSSPLAVAAARRQYEDQSAVSGADATVNAQLAAREAQRGAATGVENTRSAANRYKTGAQIGAAEDMGNFAQNALNTEEGLRMAGAQDISNRNLGIGAQLGGMGQQNANTLLNAQTGNANAYQSGGLAAGQYNQSMGYGAAADAEANQANRAGAIATNRQNTNQANQGNQFGRGYQVNATQSGLNQGVADKGLAGQQEVRNYYTGQQGYQGQQGNQAQQNMLANRQQTQQGTEGATQGAANWELGNKNAGNWFTKNVLPAVNTYANAYKATNG